MPVDRITRIGLLVFLCFACLWGAPAHGGVPASVTAVNGIVDLRGWDFEHQGPVSLSGQWLFYWQTFKPPGTIHFATPGESVSRIPVPGAWNRYTGGGKAKGGQGYATMAVRVLLPGPAIPLALSIREIITAYDLIINGKPVLSVGKTGKTPGDTVPEYRPVIAGIEPGPATLDIVIHISNYHHRLGGPWSKIVLGPEAALRQGASKNLAKNLFMIGSICIMGLYHLSLFFLRKRWLSPLYLGVFCLLICMRALATNQRHLHLMFPRLSWEVLLKTEYLGFYLAVPAFALFIFSLFPKEFSKKALACILLTAAGFSLAVLVFPAGVYSHTVVPYEMFTLTACIYLFPVLGMAARKRREGIWAVIFGFIALFACGVNDILYSNDIIKTAYTLQAGMFIFVFFQAYILSLQYSRTFQKVEKQAMALTREIELKEKLEASLVQSHEQFKSSRFALILGLAKLAEYRDLSTGYHLERMREYARIIALDLSCTEGYRAYITPDYIQDLFQSAILHDIGKVGIPDDILLKPGELTPKEFEIMKRHAVIGGDAITEVSAKVTVRSFLTLGREIAYYHHERWDGTGYPEGLSGKDIPLSARITALADVYDALTSVRPYKQAFSHEKAMDIITRDSGTHFDPDIVAAFLRRSDRINRVRQQFSKLGPVGDTGLIDEETGAAAAQIQALPG